MSRLGVVLQESEREGAASGRTTILCFLREQMDVSDDARARRRGLKERLGLKRIGCCGAAWGFGAPAEISVHENDDDDDEPQQQQQQEQEAEESSARVDRGDPGAGMNLAAALAAERQYRAGGKVSLMRLLEESAEEAAEEGCCVCMGRRKGAAFIPCGHTFCRVCSRELWLNRGSCPLCNRPILDILDIF